MHHTPKHIPLVAIPKIAVPAIAKTKVVLSQGIPKPYSKDKPQRPMHITKTFIPISKSSMDFLELNIRKESVASDAIADTDDSNKTLSSKNPTTVSTKASEIANATCVSHNQSNDSEQVPNTQLQASPNEASQSFVVAKGDQRLNKRCSFSIPHELHDKQSSGPPELLAQFPDRPSAAVDSERDYRAPDSSSSSSSHPQVPASCNTLPSRDNALSPFKSAALDFLFNDSTAANINNCQESSPIQTPETQMSSYGHAQNLQDAQAHNFPKAVPTILFKSKAQLDDEMHVEISAEQRRERFPPPPLGKLINPEYYGINTGITGELVKPEDIKVWELPDHNNLNQLRSRLIQFMSNNNLKQADICRFTGLGAPYLSFIVKDPTISNFSLKRRVEVYSVLKAFFEKVDNEEVTLDDIARLVLISKAAARALNSRKKKSALEGEEKIKIRRRRRGRPRSAKKVKGDDGAPIDHLLAATAFSSLAPNEDNWLGQAWQGNVKRSHNDEPNDPKLKRFTDDESSATKHILRLLSLCVHRLDHDQLSQIIKTLLASHGLFSASSNQMKAQQCQQMLQLLLRPDLANAASEEKQGCQSSFINDVCALLNIFSALINGQNKQTSSLSAEDFSAHTDGNGSQPRSEDFFPMESSEFNLYPQSRESANTSSLTRNEFSHKRIKRQSVQDYTASSSSSSVPSLIHKPFLPDQVETPLHFLNAANSPVRRTAQNGAASCTGVSNTDVKITSSLDADVDFKQLLKTFEDAAQALPSQQSEKKDYYLHKLLDDIREYVNDVNAKGKHQGEDAARQSAHDDTKLCESFTVASRTLNEGDSVSMAEEMQSFCPWLKSLITIMDKERSTENTFCLSNCGHLAQSSPCLSQSPCTTSCPIGNRDSLTGSGKASAKASVQVPFHDDNPALKASSLHSNALAVLCETNPSSELYNPRLEPRPEGLVFTNGLVCYPRVPTQKATYLTEHTSQSAATELQWRLLNSQKNLHAVRLHWKNEEHEIDETVLCAVCEGHNSIAMFAKACAQAKNLPEKAAVDLTESILKQADIFQSLERLFEETVSKLAATLHQPVHEDIPGMNRKIFINCKFENAIAVDFIEWNLSRPPYKAKEILRQFFHKMNISQSHLLRVMISFLKSVVHEKLKFVQECSSILFNESASNHRTACFSSIQGSSKDRQVGHRQPPHPVHKAPNCDMTTAYPPPLPFKASNAENQYASFSTCADLAPCEKPPFELFSDTKSESSLSTNDDVNDDTLFAEVRSQKVNIKSADSRNRSLSQSSMPGTYSLASIMTGNYSHCENYNNAQFSE